MRRMLQLSMLCGTGVFSVPAFAANQGMLGAEELRLAQAHPVPVTPAQPLPEPPAAAAPPPAAAQPPATPGAAQTETEQERATAPTSPRCRRRSWWTPRLRPRANASQMERNRSLTRVA